MNNYLIGHRKALDSINILLNNKDIYDCILLIGPKGIGKYKTACLITYSLLYEQKKIFFNIMDDKRIINNPDVLFLKNRITQNKGVDIELIKQITIFLKRKPLFSKKSIVLIDYIDNLNIENTNFFLKALEKKNNNSVLILIVNRMSILLPTLLSKSKLIFFKNLNIYELKIFIRNNIGGLTSEEEDILIMLSSGSPGNAKIIYKVNGLCLFKKFLKIIENLNNVRFDQKLNDFLSFIILLENYEYKYNYIDIIYFIIELWMARAIKLLVLDSKGYPLSIEMSAIKSLKELGDIYFWSNFLFKLSSVFKEYKMFSLCKYSLLIEIFSCWKTLIPMREDI